MNYVGSNAATALRFAAQETLKYLETSEAFEQFQLAEGQFHTGDDPIVADSEAHEHFESALRRHPAFSELRIWGVVGEERIVPPPSSLNAGTRVVVLDSLDGSSTWTMLRQGYCVAALTLTANGRGQLEFECGVIANPVHSFTLRGGYLTFGPTFHGPADDILMTSTLPENPLRRESLAINGYKARDRDFIVALMTELPEWDIVTLGGNAATPYVVAGGLTAVVNTRPQCTWDALGVLFATVTDAAVGDTEGTLVKGPDFVRRYNRLLLAGNVRCIPPMIVAKNETRFHEIAEAIDRAAERAPLPNFLEP